MMPPSHIWLGSCSPFFVKFYVNTITLVALDKWLSCSPPFPRGQNSIAGERFWMYEKVWYFIIQQKLFTSKNFSRSASMSMSLIVGLSIKSDKSSHFALLFLFLLHLVLSSLLHFLRLRLRLRSGFKLRPPEIPWLLAMAVKSSSYRLTFTNTFIIHIIRRVRLLRSVKINADIVNVSARMMLVNHSSWST